MNQSVLDDDDEYVLDEVKGRVGAKKRMNILNKTKLSDEELFELMGEDEKKV